MRDASVVDGWFVLERSRSPASLAGVFAARGCARARRQPTRRRKITVKASEFKFVLLEAERPRRAPVIFTVINKGKISHDFKIAGKKTPTLLPGKTAKLTVKFTKKGQYAFLCTLPGHARRGHEGQVRRRRHGKPVATTTPTTTTPTTTTTPPPTGPVGNANDDRNGEHVRVRASTLSQQSIPSGQVTFVIKNNGNEVHNFTVQGVKAGTLLNPGPVGDLDGRLAGTALQLRLRRAVPHRPRHVGDSDRQPLMSCRGRPPAEAASPGGSITMADMTSVERGAANSAALGRATEITRSAARQHRDGRARQARAGRARARGARLRRARAARGRARARPRPSSRGRSRGSIEGATVSRIQCTPDLQPTDVTGLSVWDPQERRFEFRPGPIFANVLLVDEINRALPKAQSALLEAMAERQVTVDGTSRPLPDPVPPDRDREPDRAGGHVPAARGAARPVLPAHLARLSDGRAGARDPRRASCTAIRSSCCGRSSRSTDLAVLVAAVEEVYVDPLLKRWIVELVRATRELEQVEVGASVRASLALERAVRAWALIAGRSYVVPGRRRAPLRARRRPPARARRRLRRRRRVARPGAARPRDLGGLPRARAAARSRTGTRNASGSA